MKIKNRRGSTLVITLMVFSILMILSTTILSIMSTNNKQAVLHRNKIQAYYVARSGAEAAEATILNMESNDIEGFGDSIELEIKEFEEQGLQSLKINKEENKLIIVSEAKIGNSYEKVEKVMDKGSEYGGRGVLREHDNINYLGKSPDISKSYKLDNKTYKDIGGRKYEVIKSYRDLKKQIKEDKLEGNYYFDFEIEKECKKTSFKIYNSNIYTKEKL